MRYILLLLLILVIYTASNSCTKAPQEPITPTDSLPAGSYTAANKWECTIDGIKYSGNVDTSFMELFWYYQEHDSIIACTGTSEDKRSHIQFKVAMDRTAHPASGVYDGHSYIIFNTDAGNLFLEDVSSNMSTLRYVIDTFVNNNLLISFNGVLVDKENKSHVISGSFSCKLNTGSNEPGKYYYLSDSSKQQGYFISSMLNANTLIMEGFDYTSRYIKQIRLAVRTGGTIKPGTYKSSDGDVAFNSRASSPENSITDSFGQMSVTITSVNGDVVKGYFSGIISSFTKIDSGSFTCRVANYVPQQIAASRWAFNTLDNDFFGLYNCYAGNITNAEKSKQGDKYYLTLDGESDNGASSFKLVISSIHPISRGEYWLIESYDGFLDTLYFKSGVAEWPGLIKSYYADAGVMNLGLATRCFIDTIDDRHVVGTLSGELASGIFPSFNSAVISKGSFNAGF